MSHSSLDSNKFTSYQVFVIAILAFLQFTIILDFMIMSPLGAILMPALNITPAQFGTVVSAYAISAGFSGFLAAGFADRFDRKKLLLFFYAGFVIGTLFCGLAPSYYFLLGARIFTGIFGGVIGSIVMAISTDLFPFQMRGRVMGYLQTAFAASQILGIPAGLFFSNHWGWHSPFMMIVGVSTVVGVVIVVYLKPVNAHLNQKNSENAFSHLVNTLKNTKYILPFITTGLLSLGGYMLMPFSSAFTVHNLGITIDKLPLIYLLTGIASMFIGPLIGKAADTFGKFQVFVFGSVVSIVMVLIYTNLGITPLLAVVLVNAVMFIGIFSRMIPSQALMSAIPRPESRGSFMAVSASLQQFAGGIASLLAGLIVVEGAGGVLEHFDTLGYIIVVTTLVTMANMYIINRRINQPTT
ncbi:MAG: MFS transporter [Bdellovibrionaceae bacterium]|nr:MFS transporter [Pseudobdellovibrionaceae bacterium]